MVEFRPLDAQEQYELDQEMLRLAELEKKKNQPKEQIMKLDRMKFFDKMLMTIKNAHFDKDKELFGKQDPFIEFEYKGQFM